MITTIMSNCTNSQGRQRGRCASARAGSAAFCREVVRRVSELKTKLLEQFRHEFAFRSNEMLFQRAVGEAEALAWLTPFPHLVLPELAREKIRHAQNWAVRQQAIREGRGLAFTS